MRKAFHNNKDFAGGLRQWRKATPFPEGRRSCRRRYTSNTSSAVAGIDHGGLGGYTASTVAEELEDVVVLLYPPGKECETAYNTNRFTSYLAQCAAGGRCASGGSGGKDATR